MKTHSHVSILDSSERENNPRGWRQVEGKFHSNSIQNARLKNDKVIIIGAGLGGLGAAISISLAGHNVTVLESASEIAEVHSSHPLP